MLARPIYLLAVLACLWPQAARPAEQARFTLDLPIRCIPGETCWIPNYVDLKPGKGAVDYTCGDATYDAPPRDQHKGTDFAVSDMAAVRQGIAVVAAAPGVVVGKRDSMVDVDAGEKGARSVKGKECGNAVRIKHDNGLITQYCHMRRGSVEVNKGDRVGRGQQLGLVGLSGMTQFPHLHFQIEKGKKIIDPFAGLERKKKCGAGENPLWDDKTLAALSYQPTAIYNAGFAPEKPDLKKVREGLYKDDRFYRNATAIVLWADIFRVHAGDRLAFKITGPNGETVKEKSFPIKDKKARYYAFLGSRSSKAVWPIGTYRGEVRLIRKGEKPEKYFVTRKVEVR